MPNMQPDDLPIVQNSTRGPWCGTDTCVDVKRHDGGVDLTSTIDGNDGCVTYTHAEWNQFVGDVKAGHWDHTIG